MRELLHDEAGQRYERLASTAVITAYSMVEPVLRVTVDVMSAT